MILMIDNYDSFTYNLYQYIGEMVDEIMVVRNDQISVDEIETVRTSHLIISPGPGYPSQAGISLEVIRRFAGRIPILGVCLGHQAIGEAFGGRVVHAARLVHGKSDDVKLHPSVLFEGLPGTIRAGRYHSLVIDPAALPEVLIVTAQTEAREIMAVEHVLYPVYGVQFHPESILTPLGKEILRNFLRVRPDVRSMQEGFMNKHEAAKSAVS